MPATQSHIRRVTNVTASMLGPTPEAFLSNLGGPAFLQISGADSNRYRVIVTLVHGNEPSGLRAIHHLLQNDIVPATDLGIIIASVDAALTPPVFSHRYLPDEADLNRCFAPPYLTAQQKLAASILNILAERKAEAIVDTHNTSSISKPFTVTTHHNPHTHQLATRFADFLVVLEQPMGTLLEYVSPDSPVITVEFGSYLDPDADQLAQLTLERFITDPGLTMTKKAINILEHPMRLETTSSVAYSSQIRPDAALTMINSIDQLNFQKINPGRTLGWYQPNSIPHLVAINAYGEDQIDELFSFAEGIVRNKVAMTLFMATTDPEVARSDCLLYFCLDTPAKSH